MDNYWFDPQLWCQRPAVTGKTVKGPARIYAWACGGGHESTDYCLARGLQVLPIGVQAINTRRKGHRWLATRVLKSASCIRAQLVGRWTPAIVREEG